MQVHMCPAGSHQFLMYIKLIRVDSFKEYYHMLISYLLFLIIVFKIIHNEDPVPGKSDSYIHISCK